MACAKQSAIQYLKVYRVNLVTKMRNLPLIVENLYQQKVFSEHEVDALKAERTEFDKARSILDWVVKKGEEASYQLLSILDVTQKRTLSPELHYWISCFPFRVEDAETSYTFGTKPCQNYQTRLREKAKNILKDQRKGCRKYLEKEQVNFQFIPLVLETDCVAQTPENKIKCKNKKCKKLRNKKLRAYIPKEEHTLSPLDLLKGHHKKILLIGKPGIGKTTVVQEMLRLWAEKSDKALDYMFYFSESSLSHSSNIGSLESVLFDVYLKPMEKDRKEVFGDIEENSENVVIVFDGVTDLEENSILWKIMHQELLPDAKIVITCRSEVEDDPLFSDWPTQKVYVQGFSDKSIQTYYQKMLGSNSDLLNIILKNQELLSLSHVPMYAFIAAAITPFKQNKGKNSLHTVTYMYIHIFRLAVERHGKRKYYQTDKYLGEIKDQIQPLMEKAYNATMQKNLNLTNCDETDICHAFLKMITTRDSATSGKTYCAFLHNTMQEFFSALWLLENPGNIKNVLQLSQTKEHKHMRHVLPFLCGLLSQHNSRLLKSLFPEDQMKKTHDWFIKKLLNSFFGASESQSHSEQFDLLYMCQCLYELQSPKACLMFLEKMNHQIEPEVDLDPHQRCALAYIIAQSRDKEVYVKLENCDLMDTGMDMMLSCSPNIRLKLHEEPLKQIAILLEFFHKASQCCCTFSCVRNENNCDICKALLDLCSHVKNYETQTGRRFLPALQSVFQSPDVWIIDLSERKTSLLLEVLKLQTEKKPVELIRCSEEESEVRSFLQCLPFISQLRFWQMGDKGKRFLMNLIPAAVENDTDKGTSFLNLLSSVCSYKGFPLEECNNDLIQSDFLLDLCVHLKDFETQTCRRFLPALQSVFQSPDVWIIDLSQRKTTILLEVLKLQTEKKPVELRGCSEEESEVRSFLQCLPFISQLRIDCWSSSHVVQFLLRLFMKAAEIKTEQMLKQLSSVCTYSSFPYQLTDRIKQSDFLLDLYSHVKNYKTKTGWRFLPALQSVFQSPDVWIIDLSERKTSVLLEVLKLQTKKKPVELREFSDEESELRSFLQCLPFISQLRFSKWRENDHCICLLRLFIKAAEVETQTGKHMLKLLSSVCTYRSFPHEKFDRIKQSNFLLCLCSHVKNYETQTGRSFLPALQSVFQTPDVWIIDLSERKSSVLLEVLKLQTEKKPVELRGCPEKNREVRRFLQCLPFISQLRFWHTGDKEKKFLMNLIPAAVQNDTDTETSFLNLLLSVCSYKNFPFNEECDDCNQTNFLLDLCSYVKNYETQTGRRFLSALQSVFQIPDVWIIDLSQRKSSILLEVLKLQREKKPVELRGCLEEESEVRSFLQCLRFISQLIFSNQSENDQSRFLVSLFIKAAEVETQTGEQMLKLLSSVCIYTSFPYEKTDITKQTDFLLDLYSHVKNYETQTSRSLLPALQSVFQFPDVWIIDLSKRKTSVLMEVLNLQANKKPLELRRCSEKKSKVRRLLQCLPFISQLRFSKPSKSVQSKFLLRLFINAAETQTQTGEQMLKLLSSVCTYSAFPYEKTDRIKQSDFLLDLYSHVKNYETQTSRSLLPELQSVFQSPDVWIIDLSDKKTSVLLEVLKLQTEKKPVELRGCSEDESEVRSFLQCLPFISQLRPSERALQKLLEHIFEFQNEKSTQHFLQRLNGDLTSCSLTWEELRYFLQHSIKKITVDLRKSNIQCNMREILPLLNRIKLKGMSSSFMLSVIREIYKFCSAGFVFSLLSSVGNCINLQCRDLDSGDCAALCFTLQHCTAASLNLMWTIIPEEELETFLPLLKHVSYLSVDRLLLLEMLHCCSVSDIHQRSVFLLSALQHKLDFSCCSALDLTANTDSEPLQLTADDCRVMSRVIQRANTGRKTQLILQDCEIDTAGMDQLFPVLHSVKLCCAKPLLLQFLAHVRRRQAESLSAALGEELDLSQTPLNPQACRDLALILEYSEGLTELDLSQCHLTDRCLNLLLPNLHKAQNIDFSGNYITDFGAQKIYNVVSHNSNIKTVRLFNNRIESKELFKAPQFEIW